MPTKKLKKIILATVFALGVAAPAIANPPSRNEIFNPSSPSDKTIADYFELRDVLKGNIQKCIALIQISYKRDRFDCIDVVNQGNRNFNRISDGMCGKGGLWAGTTFCSRATTRLPTLQLDIKIVLPQY
jgi:transposase